MTISLIVPYYESDDTKPAILKKMLDLVEGQYDELIVVDDKIINLAVKINKGFKKAKGDYLIMLTDDIFLTSGSLRDLPKLNAVTCPAINGETNNLGNGFCQPRWVYEETGGYFEGYAGFFCEDSDYVETLRSLNIPIEWNAAVNFDHPIGGRTLNSFPDHRSMSFVNKEIFYERWGKRL